MEVTNILMKNIIVIFIFCISFYFGGCSNNSSSSANNSMGFVTDSTIAHVNEMDTLSEEERRLYNEIDEAIQNNKLYEIINFEDENNLKNSVGQIKYDFNRDGKIETLVYRIEVEINEYGFNSVNKCELSIHNNNIIYNSLEYSAGIKAINIGDVNKSDNLIDIYISDGYLADRVVNTFYCYDGKIVETCKIDSMLLNHFGDGKIYYWEGCVDSHSDVGLNKDLVLVYFDYINRKFSNTDQIIGKVISFEHEVFLYKTKDDVVYGAPITPEDIREQHSNSILQTLKEGEKLKVLSIDGVIKKDGNKYINQDNGIKVQTVEGTIGWVGGFHMVWD
jgi:TusA-related sulfurtransferase